MPGEEVRQVDPSEAEHIAKALADQFLAGRGPLQGPTKELCVSTMADAVRGFAERGELYQLGDGRYALGFGEGAVNVIHWEAGDIRGLQGIAALLKDQ